MDKLDNKKIAIIGVGHIGNSLFKGFVNSGVKKENIILSNKSDDNRKAARQADTILIAVKPLIVKQVLIDLKDVIKDKLILSVAAGISTDHIQRYLENDSQKIIRLMPNVAVSSNDGVIGIFSNENISDELKLSVKELLSKLGAIIEVKKETDIDNLMFISACGPAIIAYFMETLADNGRKLGLTGRIADKLVLETIKSTVNYLQKSELSFTDLQQSVSTKGGITAEILESMKKQQFEEIFAKSIQNGYSRLSKLKKEVN